MGRAACARASLDRAPVGGMMRREGEMQTIYGSHSAIAPFRLLRPARLEDAAAAAADGAACLAGGVDLVPTLRAGRKVDCVVYLGGIEALKRIERRDAVLRIGAGVTHARLAEDPAVAEAVPDLPRIWRGVANVRVRHAATVGGNVMARNPQYDMLPALLALDAGLVFARAGGTFETVRADAAAWPEGILAAIDIPLAAGRRFAFERGMKPVISLAVCIERNGDRGRAAIGCAYDRALCREFALGGARGEDPAGAAADAFARDLPEPVSDWIASGPYRRTLARVLLARQLRAFSPR
jgi:CO/xanthine dehydrogenase FAD-binding subunit